jgi:hypothetical protein
VSLLASVSHGIGPVFELGGSLDGEAVQERTSVDFDGFGGPARIQGLASGPQVRPDDLPIQRQVLPSLTDYSVPEFLLEDVEGLREHTPSLAGIGVGPKETDDAIPGHTGLASVGQDRQKGDPLALSGPAEDSSPIDFEGGGPEEPKVDQAVALPSEVGGYRRDEAAPGGSMQTS